MARHSACLKEALARFDAATGDEVNDEARIRSGSILIQDGRAEEAIARLESAKPHDDRELQYWHALFLGRALYAADRVEDAAKAYQTALDLYPRAQSAGLGLSIALVRLYRFDDADAIARSIRSADVRTPDPWVYYPLGDERFASSAISVARLQAVAILTGGRLVRAPQRDIGDVITDAITEFRQSYVVRYTLTDAAIEG